MLDANSAKPTSAQAFGVNVEEKEEEEVSNEVVEEEKEEVLEEAEAETFEL